MTKAFTKAAEGAGIILIGVIISKLLHYIYRVLIARMLSPEDYGLVILGISIVSIAGGIALFGLNQAAERNLSYYYKDKNKLKGVIFSIIKFGLPLSIILSLAVFFFSQEISSLIKKENLVGLLKLFSLGVIGYSLSEIASSMLRALKLIKEFVYTKYIIEPMIRALFTFCFIILGLRIEGAVIAYVLSLFLSLLIAIYLLKRNLVFFKEKIKSINMDRTVLSFAWPLLFTGIIFSVTGWIDTLMIAYYSTEKLVGIYNIALPIAGLIVVTQSSFDGIFIPIMSSLYAKKKYYNMQKMYESITKWITLLAVLLFILVVFFSKGIINILFGAEYLDAVIPSIILAVGFLFAMLVGPCENMLNVISKTKIKMYFRGVMLIINILLNIILIPRYSIIGAAIATSFALVVYNILCLCYIKMEFKLSIFKTKTFLLIILSPIAPLLLSFAYNQLNMKFTLFFVILSIVYFFLVIALIKYLNREDIELIYDLEEKLNIKSHKISSIMRKFSSNH